MLRMLGVGCCRASVVWRSADVVLWMFAGIAATSSRGMVNALGPPREDERRIRRVRSRSDAIPVQAELNY